MGTQTELDTLFQDRVWNRDTTQTYTGEDGSYLEIGNPARLSLPNATISLSFRMDTLWGNQALISKDNSGSAEGDFTVRVENGTLVVNLADGAKTHHLRVPDLILDDGQTYHLAVSMGEAGLMVWLDGALVAADADLKVGLDQNDHALVIGGSRAWTTQERDAHWLADGTIGDIMIFGSQLHEDDVALLAGATDPVLGMAAEMDNAMDRLAPLFEQVHHGSDTLKAILAGYGVTAHGHLHGGGTVRAFGRADNSLNGTVAGDLLNGGGGDDTVNGRAGDDILQGDYGNDLLRGGEGNDILDGGHGEDTLRGGEGNDLLISRADAREPMPAYDPDRDEGDPDGELTNGKLYPDQPIPADDVLEGGAGADIFYFQTLINAKDYLIEKHTRSDGTINWHGVAGENEDIHDHWVDMIGNEVILDYSRAEGDRIVIEGHTTEIGTITYGDVDGDGVMDHSVITLYSNQGSGGGAHANDPLGTITVYGDLVTLADIEQDAGPAYGIVHTIDDLEEAIAPDHISADTGPIAPPQNIPGLADVQVAGVEDPAFAIAGKAAFSGEDEDFMNVGDPGSLSLPNATISLSFRMDTLWGNQALISKDNSGSAEGDFTVRVENGTLVVNLADGAKTHHLRVPDLILDDGQTYHLAVSMGEAGLMVWLDGALVAADADLKVGLDQNDHALVIGGSRAWTTQERDAHWLADGTIGDIMIFGSQLHEDDVALLAGATDPVLGMAAEMDNAMDRLAPLFEQVHHGSDTLKAILAGYGVTAHGHLHGGGTVRAFGRADNSLNGTVAGDLLNGGGGDDTVNGRAGDDILQGDYGNDLLRGGEGNDILDGGHGEDTLRGGEGNDLLISRADAREPMPAYDPDRDEGDPDGELTNGKLYPDQPIPADDVLEGGAGADIFYFQTLINAKDYLIEKHTRSDGTINWHGVAGENEDIHDHWVDMIGNEVILDYSRAEGDRIVIEGHTTEIGTITYGDVDGDGVMDHSVITLYSNQGSGGGAHANDPLGTITVYGDLVTLADIEQDAGPAYGIVHTIDDLEEAIAPDHISADTGPIAPPQNIPGLADVQVAGVEDPAFAIAGKAAFSGEDEDFMNVGDPGSLSLPNATISLSFRMDTLWGNQALISKDNSGSAEGDFTVRVENGTLVVNLADGAKTHHLRVPDLILDDGQTYHLAVSMGEAGLMVWLDGALVAADADLKVGLDQNDHALVIGGSRAWTTQERDAHWLADGTIGDIMIFGSQLHEDDVALLAGATDPVLGMAAEMDNAMDRLAPLFEQVHHGSDTLKAILAGYGVTAHGHLHGGGTVRAFGRADNSLNGTVAGDLLNGGGGDDTVNGRAGDDILQGDYGNDLLRGGEGNDILDGGHGEDTLRGGEGNDLLISRADAREPMPAYDPDRDEGDPDGELTNGKLYPDQPIPADDVLEGGAGADIFYFQTLINAKDYLIEKHTRSDGTINWHGVAGENEDIHDHWVDMIGNEVILDYSRAEGDRIVIEGHTTEIGTITYGDVDGDGVMDHSVITLYSNQGSGGGAHANDPLGTITVYGDLVTLADIEQDAGPAYGIVHTIDDLEEAIAPDHISADTGPIAPPQNIPGLSAFRAASGATAIFAAGGTFTFDRDARTPLVFERPEVMEVGSGTIAMTFALAELGGNQAIFSKDASGYGRGGHLTVYVEEDGDLVLRIQERDKSHYFKAETLVEEGETYELAVSYGRKGLSVYVDGIEVINAPTVTQGLNANTEALVVGAAGWNNTPGEVDNINSHFDGTISDIVVYRSQLTGAQVFGADPHQDHLSLSDSVLDYAFAQDQNGALLVSQNGVDIPIPQGTTALRFDDFDARVDDFRFGTPAADTVNGKDGADVLIGGDGNDVLRGHRNDDVLLGGDGNDSLSGGDANDLLLGEAGNDSLSGDDGRDTLMGGDGNDTLKGGAHNDDLYGGLGDDTIYGQFWGEAGTATGDRACYDGNFTDYSFESYSYYNSHRGETVTVLVITDHAGGGLDGFYEGRDHLIDIDTLVFADQSVAVDTLL